MIKHKPWKKIHSQSVPPTEHVCYTKRKPSLTRLASQVQSLSNLLNTNGIPLYTQKSIQLQRVEFMKDSSIFIRSQPSREEDNGWPPSVFVSNISHCGLTKHEITKWSQYYWFPSNMISPFKLGQCCTYLMVYLSLSCIKGKVSRSFAFPNLSIYYSLNVINVPNWYPKA